MCFGGEFGWRSVCEKFNILQLPLRRHTDVDSAEWKEPKHGAIVKLGGHSESLLASPERPSLHPNKPQRSSILDRPVEPSLPPLRILSSGSDNDRCSKERSE
ncbi:hypothetical protein BLNAU_16844 [Blattamonas nauphoetae]|uniref:Uncharacterized protein n=1 Tax=Blattamonas nauphoetae TaxID=2049346 RepID=A0ABQ9XAH2_9EUKA|nr:hypothetical protein BLNAU_16844 [Blattamonas nauphoetae]